MQPWLYGVSGIHIDSDTTLCQTGREEGWSDFERGNDVGKRGMPAENTGRDVFQLRFRVVRPPYHLGK